MMTCRLDGIAPRHPAAAAPLTRVITRREGASERLSWRHVSFCGCRRALRRIQPARAGVRFSQRARAGEPERSRPVSWGQVEPGRQDPTLTGRNHRPAADKAPLCGRRRFDEWSRDDRRGEIKWARRVPSRPSRRDGCPAVSRVRQGTIHRGLRWRPADVNPLTGLMTINSRPFTRIREPGRFDAQMIRVSGKAVYAVLR